MKMVKDFINKMEESNILVSREKTFNEYASELKQFQQMVCEMVAGDRYHDGMRFDEAAYILQGNARAKHIQDQLPIKRGVETLRNLNKEAAVVLSGADREKRVFDTLNFLNKPNTKVFNNVYLSNGTEQTEIDSIVLTDTGIIILEIKNVASDLTITQDGRLSFSGVASHKNIPLAEKMKLKTHLLRAHLINAVNAKGSNIYVSVDNLLVFAPPKDKFIRIDDKYGRMKHCFYTGMNKKIENYTGRTQYSDEQLQTLAEILEEMQSNVKRFKTNLNYDEVRRDIAAALAILQTAAVGPKEFSADGNKLIVKNQEKHIGAFERQHVKESNVKQTDDFDNGVMEWVASIIRAVMNKDAWSA